MASIKAHGMLIYANLLVKLMPYALLKATHPTHRRAIIC
jgi:hypothetical protein